MTATPRRSLTLLILLGTLLSQASPAAAGPLDETPFLTVSPSGRTVPPDNATTVSFNVTVENRGLWVGNVTLSVASPAAGITVALDRQEVLLGPNQRVDALLTARANATVRDGLYRIPVTATRAGAGSVVAYANLTVARPAPPPEPAPFAFTFTIPAANKTLVSGRTTTFDLVVTNTGGRAGEVSFSVFEPTSRLRLLVTPQNVTLRVGETKSTVLYVNATGTPVGTYELSVRPFIPGNSTGFPARKVSVTVTDAPPAGTEPPAPAPRHGIALTEYRNPGDLVAGTNGTYLVAVRNTGNVAADVLLSSRGVPPGLTVRLNTTRATLQAGESRSLQVTVHADRDLAAGTYAFLIHGIVAGNASAQQNLTLRAVVTTPPSPPPPPPGDEPPANGTQEEPPVTTPPSDNVSAPTNGTLPETPSSNATKERPLEIPEHNRTSPVNETPPETPGSTEDDPPPGNHTLPGPPGDEGDAPANAGPTGEAPPVGDVTEGPRVANASADEAGLVEDFTGLLTRDPRASLLALAGAALAGAAGGTVLLLRHESRRYVALAPLAGLYTRLARSKVLDHEDRDKLHDLILQSPGIHYGALKRATGLNAGALVHHLRTLEKHQLVASRREGPHRRFYPVGKRMPAPVAAPLTAMQARILDLLAAGPLTQRELAERLDLTQQGANYHVKTLERAGRLSLRMEAGQWRCHRAPGPEAQPPHPDTPSQNVYK